MKVLEGKFRRYTLRGLPPAQEARPTARRSRETLFQLLAPCLDGARFLDLCAGSGAVGIEALSRGAAHVVFVDRERAMCELIEANLQLCGVSEQQAEIVNSDAEESLRHAALREDMRWDIAFYDPPYETDYAPMLAIFGEGRVLAGRRSVLVVEHACERKLDEAFGILRRWRVVRRGNVCLSFYEMKRRGAML